MVDQIKGFKHVSSGKVRDIYVNEANSEQLLVVASDRISAFDFVLSTPIPDKGKILTQLSAWWFRQLDVDNHMISMDVPSEVDGRAMLCERLDMVAVECVARGYLTGSGLAEYKELGTVTGIELPHGLQEASKLPEAIFTPAAKAELGEHDENVPFSKVVAMVGEQRAKELRQATLSIYAQASELASKRGIILADTKFEFGVRKDGSLVLADEVLTPDSSRFWPADKWVEGAATPSFDKQYVRDWLLSRQANWDRASAVQPPPLPPEVVERTRERYVEAFELITGTPFQP